jgi:hypothetical protein
MVKQILLATLLLSASLSVKAQEGTPRPSFFEEERRLTTPTNQEISNDRQVRQNRGFSETFLTDALNAVGDPGEGTESRSGFNTTAIDPRNPNPPSSPSGIFTRPPASGIFTNPPRVN